MIKQFTILFLLFSVVCFGQENKKSEAYEDSVNVYFQNFAASGSGPVDEKIIIPDSNEIPDKMPSFPGGDEEMRNFIKKNVIYPEYEKEGLIQGTVFVSFIVDTIGNISKVKILRGVSGGPGCDKEAMRVVKLMPKWIAAEKKGVPFEVEVCVPIIFKMR